MSTINRITVLGATSDLGKALAYRFAPEASHMVLSARKTERLEAMQQDLLVRELCSSVELLAFDAVDMDLAALRSIALRTDVLMITIGYLGDETKARNDFSEAAHIIQVNYTALVAILNIFANEMEKRGTGSIIAISSVAGERGRQSNYHYGSAKAGLTAFLSGLRNRLFSKGVHVMTVKPGFMNTRMTAGLKLPPLLTSSPKSVARQIYFAYRWRRSEIYVGGIWRWIMLGIRCIPEIVFKRMKL